jgi:hypothetical protein
MIIRSIRLECFSEKSGLTVPASVGSVLASLEQQITIQYTAAIYDDQGKPTGPYEPIQISLSETSVSNKS